MPEQQAEKRTRAKAEYSVEQLMTKPNCEPEWCFVAGAGEAFRSTADCQKFIRTRGQPGKYRIVRVCWSGEVKTETKTITRLT